MLGSFLVFNRCLCLLVSPPFVCICVHNDGDSAFFSAGRTIMVLSFASVCVVLPSPFVMLLCVIFAVLSMPATSMRCCDFCHWSSLCVQANSVANTKSSGIVLGALA